MPRFHRCDAARPPASELIAAVLAEYDALRPRRGGPSATPADFSPPSGAYVVGFVDGVAACGGGIKALGAGIAELKRMYVARLHIRDNSHRSARAGSRRGAHRLPVGVDRG